MKILITGGAGFIGSHLADAAVGAGHRVSVLDNFSTGSLSNLSSCSDSVEIVQGDVTDHDTINRVCEGVEAIFHFAAIPSVQRSVEEPLMTQRNGELATVKLLQAAVRSRVKRFILASSCSVYGKPNELPISEEAQLRPLSPYGASKLACEAYLPAFANCFGIDAVALRYFNVFGSRQDPTSPYSGVLSIFAREILMGHPLRIFGDGGQTRDFVHVKDIARANLLALDSASRFDGCAINIGGGVSYSLNEIVGVLNSILGKNVKAAYLEERPGDIKHSRADLTTARRLLKYDPSVGVEEGLRELLAEVRVL